MSIASAVIDFSDNDPIQLSWDGTATVCCFNVVIDKITAFEAKKLECDEIDAVKGAKLSLIRSNTNGKSISLTIGILPDLKSAEAWARIFTITYAKPKQNLNPNLCTAIIKYQEPK